MPVSPSTSCVIVLISLVTGKNKYEFNALMKIAYYASLNIRYKITVTKCNSLFLLIGKKSQEGVGASHA